MTESMLPSLFMSAEALQLKHLVVHVVRPEVGIPVTISAGVGVLYHIDHMLRQKPFASES